MQEANLCLPLTSRVSLKTNCFCRFNLNKNNNITWYISARRRCCRTYQARATRAVVVTRNCTSRCVTWLGASSTSRPVTRAARHETRTGRWVRQKCCLHQQRFDCIFPQCIVPQFLISSQLCSILLLFVC